MLSDEALALRQLPIHLVQELLTRQYKGPARTRVTGWTLSLTGRARAPAGPLSSSLQPKGSAAAAQIAPA